MRRIGRLLPLLALLVGVLASPASSQLPDDPTGLIISNNVKLLSSIPSPGVIGARFRDGLMYVTSVTGLTIYDIADPAAPAEIGSLPLPHFENEDVDLGGNILLISNDAAESTGILYIIDISDPTAPTLLNQVVMGGNPLLGGPGHTASCVLDCKYVWVTDLGGIRVYDLTDPLNPVDKGIFPSPANGGIATHDVQVDGDGLAWVVGFGGAVAYKLPAGYAGDGLGTIAAQTDKDGLSTYLSEFGIGDGSKPNDYILHNSERKKGSDVVYITEEDYTRPGCRGAGSFETWRVPTGAKRLPNGQQVTIIDHWETELVAAGAASPAVQCSAHYFASRKNVIAQGWYEQGIRFLDVSKPDNIRQIGFFSAPTALNWAAYFAPTDETGEIVYSLDASHGIDVLRFQRPDKGKLSVPHETCYVNCGRFRPPKVMMPIRPEWFAEPSVGTANGAYGYACRLGLGTSL